MKIRSKALYQYLHHANVIHGSDVEIAHAKLEYRKQYKRQWKQRQQASIEVRFTVSSRQYEEIKSIAAHHLLKPTTYAKQIMLADIGEPARYDSRLLEVLQLVSMSVIAIQGNRPYQQVQELINKAEIKLLQYLNT